MRNRIVLCAAVLFCTFASQNAWARAERSSSIGVRSIGVDAGFVDPDNIDGTLGVGAFANLGNITPDIRLAPHLGYWSKSEEFDGDKASIRDISLGARGEYMIRGTSPKFRPYAGAGLGFHFVHAQVDIAEQDMGGGFVIPAMTMSDSSTKLGLDLGGGFITPLNQKTDLCVDLWYTAVSDVGHVSMKVGVSFDLPN